MIRRYATDVVAVSEAVMNAAWPDQRGPQRTVLYNGVDTSGLETYIGDASGSQKKIVQVGRLDAGKNQLLSVRILAELVRGGLKDGCYLLGGIPATTAIM